MSELNVNVDNIKDDFPNVPAGIYEATISLVDFAMDKDTGGRKTDKNGNEYLKGDFVIVEGEFAKQHVFNKWPIYPDKQIFRELCHSAGFRGVCNDTDSLTGLPLKIKVSEEMYQEKMISRVVGFL